MLGSLFWEENAQARLASPFPRGFRSEGETEVAILKGPYVCKDSYGRLRAADKKGAATLPTGLPEIFPSVCLGRANSFSYSSLRPIGVWVWLPFFHSQWPLSRIPLPRLWAGVTRFF